MASILMVLTGADTWTMKSGTRHPTGFWAEEFIKPHKVFTAAGFQVHVATPQGRRPTIDELSLSLQYNNNDAAEVEGQKTYLASQEVLKKPLVLGEVDPADYDVMFVVGGHGPMQDLAVDPDIGKLMGAILASPRKVLAAVCHGPASFLSAFDAHGEWLFKGRKLTGFTNEEETQATFAGNAPWLLEDRLRLAGAEYVKAAPWTPTAVVDGNLVTGQQQVSAQKVAEAVLKLLGEAA
ncbi:type 1 glutamine amidotransferase domain-containing protein [Lichenicoccus sp.]|uniref:type 1 glutamine amidotransferase domain-containing protein n=1 Tax=Lichenicoccus sp. TaxID=2781899 RepID=UPI003D0FD839